MGGPLSISDFQFKCQSHPTLTSPTKCHHLKKIPDMTKPEIYKRIFSEISDGSFSLRRWYHGISSRAQTNLLNKKYEIFWGAESILGGQFIGSAETTFQDVGDPTSQMEEEINLDITCTESYLRKLDIMGYRFLNLNDVTRAKSLQIIPFHSSWSSNSKLWSQLCTKSDFSLLDILAGFESDKKQIFFERLKQKKLILRFNDCILGHPEDVTKPWRVTKKRDRDSMDGDNNFECLEVMRADNLNELFKVTFGVSRRLIEKWTSKLLGIVCVAKQLSFASAG